MLYRKKTSNLVNRCTTLFLFRSLTECEECLSKKYYVNILNCLNGKKKPEIARMNLTDVVRIIKAINLALLRNSKIKRQIIIYFLGGRKIQCKSLAK